MSLYVLDTDIWTLYSMGNVQVQQRVNHARSGDQVAISVITAEEQLSGWYTRLRQAKKRNEKSRAYLRLSETITNLARFAILPFPEPALVRFERLLAAKLNVRKKDLCIAAITLEHGGTLVSRNLKDFQRVPGLQVEDWSV